MIREFRSRSLFETWRLAQAAGRAAGVTRLGDITQFSGTGLPVFQAIRPLSRSLAVSQGKGGSAIAAQVSALLEAAELAVAETLPHRGMAAALASFAAPIRECWSGHRDALCIDLDLRQPRYWLDGADLRTGAPVPMPWDLLSLDFTRTPLEHPATSNGLATGNTRDEALVASLCELLEHHHAALFEDLSPPERRGLQIDVGSIDDPDLAIFLSKVVRAGFVPRMWSLGQRDGIASIHCTLFRGADELDDLLPAAGSACHPDRGVAAARAVLEAVQARAALVAGSRDDVAPSAYRNGKRRSLALAFRSLALGEGELRWREVPHARCANTAGQLDLLLRRIFALTPLPVLAFEHRSPVKGLFIVHALAPGLRDLSRTRARHDEAPPPQIATRSARTAKLVLFAGPSITGIELPQSIALRPPAVCGDLSELLDDPPSAVALIDGCFALAPTVCHKEILALISSGTTVIGGASLGALRAAELADFGMHGVGAIFAAYRVGAIRRDDAVMLTHGPADFGFVPFTIPLVDAEFALHGMKIAPRDRRMMQRIVRTVHYTLRTWDVCCELFARRTGRPFPIAPTVLEAAPSLKRLDAQVVVDMLATESWRRLPASAAPDLPITSYFARLLARSAPGFLAGRTVRIPDVRAC